MKLPFICFSRSLKRMICATPVPIIENAGINIQNHQPLEEYARKNAISMNANPMKRFFIDCSRPGSRLPCRRRARSLISLGSPSVRCTTVVPEIACGTRLIFAPQTRQKLAPSTFCAAHLGQNMVFSDQAHLGEVLTL